MELTAGGKKYAQYTVDDGGFVFMNLPTGKCTLRMEKAGYVPYCTEVSVTADEEYQKAVADVNGDGTNDILDYQRLYVAVQDLPPLT